MPKVRMEYSKRKLGRYYNILDMSPDEYSRKKGEWSKNIRNKNNGKCIECDKPAKYAHHILYASTHPHLQFELDNGMPLCKLHHAEKHRFDIHSTSALILSH